MGSAKSAGRWHDDTAPVTPCGAECRSPGSATPSRGIPGAAPTGFSPSTPPDSSRQAGPGSLDPVAAEEAEDALMRATREALARGDVDTDRVTLNEHARRFPAACQKSRQGSPSRREEKLTQSRKGAKSQKYGVFCLFCAFVAPGQGGGRSGALDPLKSPPVRCGSVRNGRRRRGVDLAKCGFSVRDDSAVGEDV
jgi:hypothetical protein